MVTENNSHTNDKPTLMKFTPERSGEWFAKPRELVSVIGTGLIEICFPPTCVFCHGVMEIEKRSIFTSSTDSCHSHCRTLGSGFCAECRSLIERSAIRHACYRCGQVLPPVELVGMETCVECQVRPSPISRMFLLGAYQQVLREAVVASKRMGYLPLAANLGDLLGLKIREAFDGTPIGAVTYVPSHWSRRLRRAGTPTLELASRVARVIGSPLVPLLKCVRRTEKQGMLTDRERRKNVQGAFVARKGYALREQRILVVDDVWTTGSTLREAAEQLRQGYDAEIFAAVVARAVGTHS